VDCILDRTLHNGHCYNFKITTKKGIKVDLQHRLCVLKIILTPGTSMCHAIQHWVICKYV